MGFLRIVLSSLALRVMAATATYLCVFFLGRWLGPEDFGRFATVLSSVLFIMTVIALGVPMGFLRTTGELRATDRLDLLQKVIRRASRLPLRLSLVLSLLGVFYSVAMVWFEPEVRFFERPLALIASFMLLPFFLMAELNASILRGFDRIAFALGPRDVLWRLSLLPIGYCVSQTFAPGTQFFPLLLVSIPVLGGLVAMQHHLIKSELAQITETTVPSEESSYDVALWSKIRPVMRRLWVTNITAIGISNLDVIAIAIFFSEESAGPYFLASRTASLVSFTQNAVVVALGPRLSASHFSGNFDRLRSDLALGATLAFVPASISFGILALYGDVVLELVGENFVPFYPILLILAGGHFFRAITGASGLLLNMTGHEVLSVKISVLALFIAIVTIGLGGYFYGVTGVAIGVAVTMVATELTVYISSRIVTGYDATLIGSVGQLIGGRGISDQ
ncbi:lipopolysaccharide biosynthesis protein [Pseudophaeobacter arcticus]|uniref:lipopolysaccharide biosynthesis protein n=1 Tax=Pseudophaeobacter arcticus TaxID=385492 RepID=UPI0004011186|nr:lipopolysaccharide biosynthesis protein [Pseudophaeobacter arcticus]